MKSIDLEKSLAELRGCFTFPLNHFGGFAILIAFRAPLLRTCKIVTRYLSRCPLPFSVLQFQLGLSSGVASSAHHCKFAVPSGTISINHFFFFFFASGSCLSSVLKRETSSWIISSYAGLWARKVVSISLIMACGSLEYGGVCICQFNISVEENDW